MKKTTRAMVATLTIAGALLATSAAQQAQAIGPLIEGWMVTQTGSYYRMSIPDGTPVGGLTPNLDSTDWMRYRVTVIHSDSSGGGFTSDDFAPTDNQIQLCTSAGCEATRINLGTENLDWDDASKISFFLEAKECLLCGWVPFEVAIE